MQSYDINHRDVVTSTHFGPEVATLWIDIATYFAALDGESSKVRIGSQDDPEFLTNVVKEIGGVDIIFDDGSHFSKHIRTRLELTIKLRDLAWFNLAIDSKLRGCDLVRLRVNDLAVGNTVCNRVSVVQSKTAKRVQFEMTENTRQVVSQWISSPAMHGQEYLFPSRLHAFSHLSIRQYARLVRDWVSAIGLDQSGYGTHSLRRTKAALIYRKTGNLRTVQLPLGHSRVDSTVRYLGVELEDALSIAEGIDL